MSLIELDLLDNSNQATKSGSNWLLNAIDTFSKYGWSIPLKSKSEKDVTIAFKKMLKEWYLYFNFNKIIHLLHQVRISNLFTICPWCIGGLTYHTYHTFLRTTL